MDGMELGAPERRRRRQAHSSSLRSAPPDTLPQHAPMAQNVRIGSAAHKEKSKRKEGEFGVAAFFVRMCSRFKLQGASPSPPLLLRLRLLSPSQKLLTDCVPRQRGGGQKGGNGSMRASPLSSQKRQAILPLFPFPPPFPPLQRGAFFEESFFGSPAVMSTRRRQANVSKMCPLAGSLYFCHFALALLLFSSLDEHGLH